MVEQRDAELTQLLSELRRIEIQSQRLVTSVLAGGYSSVFRGSGIEFDEVREYVEGDDPRRVDWNVTARVGRPYVKTYVDERELPVYFLLDLSASMGGGYGPWSARELAARVCACLAFSAVKNNDKVGLVACGERVEKFVPAKKGVRHALRVVRECLVLPASAGRGDLVPGLRLLTRAVRRHAIVFVVSDFLSRGWARAATTCARRHDVVAVRLLTPELDLAALLPAGSGLLRLRDPESGRAQLVDLGDARARAAWAERVAAWRRRVEADLARARVDRMDVPVPRRPAKDAVARPILDFFRMREERSLKR